jgi:hypothetical protein
LEKVVDPKGLKAYQDVRKHLDELVMCLTTLSLKVNDVLGLGTDKKKSKTYLEGQKEASKGLSAADRATIEEHIAALKSVQSDIKSVTEDFTKLALRNVDKDFATLGELQKKYVGTFKHAKNISRLEGTFYRSLSKELKRVYEYNGELFNASMVTTHQKLTIYFNEYPYVEMVLGPDAGKK